MVRKVLWGRLRKNGKLKVKLKQKSKYNRISKRASNTGIGSVGRKTKGENIFFFCFQAIQYSQRVHICTNKEFYVDIKKENLVKFFKTRVIF